MDGEGQAAGQPFGLSVHLDTSQLELIHSGRRHNLYRGQFLGLPSVIKVPASENLSDASAGTNGQYELLRNLKIPGIVKVRGLAQSNEGLALIMEDAGPTNFAKQIRLRPFPISDFLNIAVELAEALAALHEVRIVHRDISPSNIAWDPARAQPTLVDFGLSTTLPALALENGSDNQCQGTPAYISPEQTGRTGRPVDIRSDLYSLGASLYEMLTGTPPFTTEDPIELIHAHIARHPQPAHVLNAAVPVGLSRVIAKLLEKEPQQRYQTASALATDLRNARHRWGQTGTIDLFPLGREDTQRSLYFSDKLHGREEELRVLSDAFARASAGARELILVSGAPGIGKSALVRQLSSEITTQSGRYIAGKFDQLQRSVPFSGLAQAFRILVRQLLMEKTTVLESWRERIETAVHPNGRLLVEIVPELERVIGVQPLLPEFGPVESKNRFQLVFTDFLRVFAQPRQPLVMFLDDLQWVDAASLQLLEQWLADTSNHNFLLIGAYRDSEVGISHPLSLCLGRLRETHTPIHDLHLRPIATEDVAMLIAAALNVDARATRDLAQLIMDKSGGNPFFARRLLKQLHTEGLIWFDSRSQKWAWDLKTLRQVPISENVLDLMVEAIQRLPAATRSLLEMGACIGHRFDLATLTKVGSTPSSPVNLLWPALEDGLLLPVYRGDVGHSPPDPPHAGAELSGVVQFAHDRIQQAAYSLMTGEQRSALHLAIGRHLLNSDGQRAERLFDIVDQLDLGEALIIDPAERLQLVELNLAAGRKARTAAAYQAAFEYLTVAMRHLPEHPWAQKPELTFALHRELAECAYLTGQHSTAEQLIDTALGRAPSKVAKADLYSLRILASTVAGDWTGALQWGREGLAVFGSEWPAEGLANAIETEAAAVMINLGPRKIGDLSNEPEVENEETKACMRLLSLLGPPAYFSGAQVLTFLVTRAVNLSLMHGPSVYSAYAYVFYGAIHNARTGDYEVGYAFGRLALALARQFGNRAEESRALEVFGLVVHPWKCPVRDSLPLVREGYRAGIESGELAYAAFNLNSVLINGMAAGVTLTDILADAEIAVEFAARHKNRTSIEISLPFRQGARTLMGRSRGPDTFDDDSFNEAGFIAEAKGNETALGFFWVLKLQVAYLMGNYDEARRCVEETEKRATAGILGMVTSADLAFYSALALAAEGVGRQASVAPLLDQLRSLYGQLAAWAHHCSHNFSHKTALVGAEIARLSGASEEAMKLYRVAIESAAKHLFVQDEALAHELRGRFLLEQQEPALAAVHFRAARERYQRWGASTKAQMLDNEQPSMNETRSSTKAISIDALALIKASQTISAETLPERLFERVLKLALEVGGAQSGALLLSDGDAITVRARIGTTENDAVVIAAIPLEQCADLPSSILRYALRTKDPLVLPDAMQDGEIFATDPAVRARALRSILCLPLKKLNKVIGLLYLENNSMSGTFRDGLVDVLQVLATQAVISLENSTLLETQRRLTSTLEQRVVERTQQLTEEIVARDKAEAALRHAQKMEAVGQLTGGVAHDFNNLLMVIGANLDQLKKRFDAERNDRRFVEAALVAVNRGARLTEQLLAFARRQILAPELHDVSAVIADSQNLVRHALGESIELFVADDPDSNPCYIDPAQFDNALLNLAVNARDAMPNGGKFIISVKNVELGDRNEVEAPPGSYVLVAVSDTGVGIPPQFLDRVFEPFFTTKEFGKGTGLGLSQVYGFVKQSSGHVRIQSVEGRGTKILIYLPRVPAVGARDTSGAVRALPRSASRPQFNN